MEKRTWAKLIVTMLVIAGIAAGIYRQWYWNTDDGGSVAAWGVGKLGVAEKSYYTNRISDIVVNWQNTRRTAERGEKGRFNDSYKTLLVIDAAENAMWIEDNGQILQGNHTELSPNMKWTFYRATAQGSNELGAVTRIKLRGYNSSQNQPEQFHLVGSGRGSGHMDFHFRANGRGSGSGSGPFTPPAYNSSRKKAEDPYPSLVVTDAEYEQYCSSLSAAEPNGSDVQNTSDQSDVERNKATWRKVEKLLYQEIDRQILAAGYGLRSIKIEPGPDFSAAHAEVGVRTEGVFRGMFGGYYWGDAYLKIDLLGDDIWYAADASNPQRPGPRRRQDIDLEFFVCPTGEIPESKRAELLEKGRKIQKPLTAAMPSKWKATLPNGAIVQFIGICENPSAGKQWWGPDGTPIDYVPYLNSEVYGNPRDDRQTYEMVWKVKFPKMPDGSSGGGTSTRLEGSMGSYGRSVRDKYGNQVQGNFSAEGYSFKKSRKKTTLNIGVKVRGQSEYDRVEFQNISLVPGEDQGFKIVPEKKE